MRLLALLALLALCGLSLSGCSEDSASGAKDVSKEVPKSTSNEAYMPQPPGGNPFGKN